LMSLGGVYRRMYDTQARQAMDAVDAELGVKLGARSDEKSEVNNG
jgi:hypothetical protein